MHGTNITATTARKTDLSDMIGLLFIGVLERTEKTQQWSIAHCARELKPLSSLRKNLRFGEWRLERARLSRRALPRFQRLTARLRSLAPSILRRAFFRKPLTRWFRGQETSRRGFR